jgi:hypothetical protein
MNRLITFFTLILSLLVVSGCAGISTYPAQSKDPQGIRVYPQRIYLLVDKEKNVSKIISLPDMKSAYDVKPWSFLSKHDFNIKIEDAQVKDLTSNQDSSAALSLLQKIVEVAAEAAKGGITTGGKAVALIDFASSFGLESGIYELDEAGVFKLASPKGAGG